MDRTDLQLTTFQWYIGQQVSYNFGGAYFSMYPNLRHYGWRNYLCYQTWNCITGFRIFCLDDVL